MSYWSAAFAPFLIRRMASREWAEIFISSSLRCPVAFPIVRSKWRYRYKTMMELTWNRNFFFLFLCISIFLSSRGRVGDGRDFCVNSTARARRPSGLESSSGLIECWSPCVSSKGYSVNALTGKARTRRWKKKFQHRGGRRWNQPGLYRPMTNRRRRLRPRRSSII